MGTLTCSRKQRLRTLEKEIRSGMEEFYYTGMKLKEIRDNKLYKEDGFETWARYCRERWEWSDERARQLIVASEYREKLPEPPKSASNKEAPTTCWTEASIRQLTRIPDKKQAAKVAAKVVKAVEQSEKQTAKNPDVKPIKLSSSTVRKFVDEDLGIKPKAKQPPKPQQTGRDLACYLRSRAGQIEGITDNLAEVSADIWKLLEDDEPGLVERLATACDDLAALLRS